MFHRKPKGDTMKVLERAVKKTLSVAVAAALTLQAPLYAANVAGPGAKSGVVPVVLPTFTDKGALLVPASFFTPQTAVNNGVPGLINIEAPVSQYTASAPLESVSPHPFIGLVNSLQNQGISFT